MPDDNSINSLVNPTDPDVSTGSPDRGLDYIPAAPSSVEGLSHPMEAAKPVETAVEVRKSPEVSTPLVSADDDASTKKPTLIKPASVSDTVAPNVVDLTTDHRVLHDLKPIHSLTDFADEEEAEFIEGVEKQHADPKSQ